MKLSILMAAYNEERTVVQAASAVLATEYPCPIELIVVDDGSSDRTPELLAELTDPRVTALRHPVNRGKSAALTTAIEAATGTHMLPFDADMEYEPGDIPALIDPVLRGRCEVVYGTRLFGANTVYQSFRYALGNKLLTLAANVLFDASISDLHTCLKLIPLPLVRSMKLDANGFGMDTELTARLLRLGIRPFEVPVSYHSRSRADGKKISWQDGVHCLRILAGVRFSAKPRPAVEVMRLAAVTAHPDTPPRHIVAITRPQASGAGKTPAKGAGLNASAVIAVGETAVANSTTLSLGEV
jgi:glycosyltransferase involved in cell wall biosynthesis